MILWTSAGSYGTYMTPSPIHTNEGIVMSRKGTDGISTAIDKALEAGYRASVTVGIASRRVSEGTRLEILNELNCARAGVEEALFSLEEVGGVRGSIEDSVGRCNEFVREYRSVRASGELDKYAAGTLRDGLDDAEGATEHLRGIVDGYSSFGEDVTE